MKFNNKIVGAKKVENLAGGVAFSLTAEIELIHAVLTTFLEDKFYEKGNERLARIVDLCSQVPDSFLSNLAVIARKEFHLRSVSHVLVGELAKRHNGDDLVGRTIYEGSERPDDLSEIVSYTGILTKQMKRGIRNALLKFSPYQLAKYQMKGRAYSLVDLFNLTHPKAYLATEEQQKAWKDLINGELVCHDTWENEISAVGQIEDEEERVDTKKETWEKLVLENKLGYMALLRNLNNLISNDVSGETIKKAVEKLTNPIEVKKSKLFPFRFTTAYENVHGNRILRDAISEAMDISVNNCPSFDGKTLIALDVSGSMGSVAEKASIFAAVLLKANPAADFIQFDTEVQSKEVSSRLPVIEIAKSLVYEGGGTDTGLVFETIKKYDRIFIISDNESWSRSAQTVYENYKKHVADPFIYAFDLQGYGTKDLSGGKVFHFPSFSERIFDFVGYVERGETLVDYVKYYQF